MFRVISILGCRKIGPKAWFFNGQKEFPHRVTRPRSRGGSRGSHGRFRGKWTLGHLTERASCGQVAGHA